MPTATFKLTGEAALPRYSETELAQWREQICQQATSWFSLQVDNQVYRVPFQPFRAWALWDVRRDAAVEVPWSLVCPKDLKRPGDNQYHSDFLVGMGIDDPGCYYQDAPLKKTCEDAAFKIQQAELGHHVHVLKGRGKFTGICVHAKPDEELTSDQIAVIPFASSAYYIPVMTAGATITEAGGELSHLIVESGETGKIVVRLPGALKMFQPNCRITIDADRGIITIL